MYSTLVMQDGPVREVGENGDQPEDLLAFVIGFLQSVNRPPLNTRETSLAITHCEEALHWLNARTADRVLRGVEGTSTP